MVKDNVRTVELYLDPQQYSEEEIIYNVQQAIQEFANKDVRLNVDINEFGVYVVKIDYIDKDTYLNKLKYKIRANRNQRISKKYTDRIKEKISVPANQILIAPTTDSIPTYEKRKYGVYKETKLYRPY